MTDPLVSAVIPVYNGRCYVAAAIDSVLAQTYPRVEIVVVDDGSTDGSAEVLDSYGSKINVVRQPNGGVAAARNAGIAHSAGDFVAFLDQDDLWRPDKVERQVQLFRNDDQIGLIHTGVTHYDISTESYVGPLNPKSRPERMVGDCFERLLLGNPIYNSSVMIRRALLDRVGVCSTEISGNTVQDYDLWLRLARVGRFAFVPEELTVFRLHSAQGHRDRRTLLHEEIKLLLRSRPLPQWRATRQGRERLARLYDELATAHWEAGDAGRARQHYLNALSMQRSPRQFVRMAASRLPLSLVNRFRAAKQRLLVAT